MERILRNTAATLSVEFFSDETSTAADGAVTVTVVDDQGVALVTNAATTHGTAGKYSWTLPAQASLKHLTLSWTGTFGGIVQTLRTEAEVVGSRIFSLADVRAFDTDLDDPADYTTAQLEDARTQVEDEFEEITGRSFIQRYGRTLTLGGGGAYLRRLDDYDVQTILGGTVGGVALDGPTIAGLEVRQSCLLWRASGVWTELVRCIVHYEYGVFAGDVDTTIRDAAILRARTRLNAERSGVPEGATSFDSPDGGSVDFAGAGIAGTGIPEVDAVLQRWMTDEKVAALAAYRTAASA